LARPPSSAKPLRSRRAVFLDRDGTLIKDVNFLLEPSQIRLLPGAVEAIQLLRQAGFLVIVATNQSGVARGYLTEEKLKEIHALLQRRLVEAGAPVDAIYYCPHLPEGQVAEHARVCDCRKPAPGLLLRAAAEWNLDLSKSFVIGDAERDIEAGRRAGCRTVVIASEPPDQTAADAVAPALLDAARLILSWRARK
jgi:D-glycero-D-manno-heptose 1,7-bisphosphate phosphatase